MQREQVTNLRKPRGWQWQAAATCLGMEGYIHPEAQQQRPLKKARPGAWGKASGQQLAIREDATARDTMTSFQGGGREEIAFFSRLVVPLSNRSYLKTRGNQENHL